MLTLVVAYGPGRVIGVGGGLPWSLPTDLRHFRDRTMGGAVIMGRATWASIPDRFRPLPGRRNLVLSRDPTFIAAGAEVFSSLDDAVAAAQGDDPAIEVFVIGGGQIYAEALPTADRVIATEVELETDGDTFFPELEDGWQLVHQAEPVVEADGTRFVIRTYERGDGDREASVLVGEDELCAIPPGHDHRTGQ